MKTIFTKSFDELRDILKNIDGVWEVDQPNKKVFRYDGGVLNWFETTGTISFQGATNKKNALEEMVRSILYPGSVPLEHVVENSSSSPTDSPNETKTVESDDIGEQYLNGNFGESELIIGIVSAVGTEAGRVITPLKDRLTRFGYNVIEVKVSSLLSGKNDGKEYSRIKSLMEAGDDLRKMTNNNAILAYGASKLISEKRMETRGKVAYIINSLKHPDEVGILRKIYGQGFYLFGIHADKKRRLYYLENDKGLTAAEAAELTEIDEDEKLPHGQRTRDTYHLADFFLNFGKNDDQVKNTLQRFLELIFAHPFKNPTFDEFSMFMAFSSSVRSGDLSRQVGAVITDNKQIIATGANECPAFGGGLYWAEVDSDSGMVQDVAGGKDHTRNEDSNRAEQNEIVENILSGIKRIGNFDNDTLQKIESELEKSRISDLTEFGRVVHAEMEAILSCARSGISSVGSTLYCTTFPCHNCAKHIIAAGIKRVVYVEPYPKSKALEFHSESIHLKTTLEKDKDSRDQVMFEPFTGVGARRFLDLFSMNLGIGEKLKRKNKDGTTVIWTSTNPPPRIALLPKSYVEVEKSAAQIFDRAIKHSKEKKE